MPVLPATWSYAQSLKGACFKRVLSYIHTHTRTYKAPQRDQNNWVTTVDAFSVRKINEHVKHCMRKDDALKQMMGGGGWGGN